jgi:hypothetical protein
MGRPGLVGTMARTAVIAGTATAVSGGMQRHSAGKQQAAAQASATEAELAQYKAQEAAEQQQAQIDAQVQAALAAQAAQQQAALAAQAAAPAVAAAPAGGTDVVAELQKLAALKEQGILSDDEFAAAKVKLLGV